MTANMQHRFRRVDMAIAGVQKSGTTALAQYLAQHPDIFFPARKEMHFFDRGLNPNWALTPASAATINAWYEAAPPTALCADVTPAYVYCPDAARHMAAHNPDMRVIITLRHPVMRAYSHWSMERRRGRESLSFSEAIRGGRHRVKDNKGGVQHIYSYVERGFYSAQIHEILAHFPRAQLFFIRADKIMHTSFEMQDLLTFLGLTGIEYAAITQNVMPSSLLDPPASLDADFAYLQDIFATDLAQLSSLTGVDVKDWLDGPPRFTAFSHPD